VQIRSNEQYHEIGGLVVFRDPESGFHNSYDVIQLMSAVRCSVVLLNYSKTKGIPIDEFVTR